MTNDEGKREVPIENIPAEDEEIVEAGGQLIRSLIRAGTRLAAIPLSFVPTESQERLQGAGREVAMGLAELSREVADILESLAEEPESEEE